MKHVRITTTIAAATLALVPAAALAATIEGGPGNERLRGTSAADTINGNDGNDRLAGRGGDDTLDGGNGFDRLFGLRGDDTLRGGPQRDRLHGGPGNDTSDGGDGNDRLAGGTGDDTQNGGPGNDVIYANVGADVSNGGDGNDVLWALARRDVTLGANGEPDQTGDTLDGGNGNDRFRTRDGEVDRITCGEGDDVAFLDRVDVITDATAESPNGSCEKVVRAARADSSQAEDVQQTTAEEKAQA